ncbi:MAG TPA: DNA repair protein RecO [Rhizomicrobium sp.]|jgi:DNA repair protein RecO (recombination protein O)
MDWQDDAIVLGARRYGESSAVLEVLTRAHGRHQGLVRGGGSRRQKPVLLAGNTVSVAWRARLEEHLGGFTVELQRSRAGEILDRGDALTGLNAFAEIARAVLPEREPCESVYVGAEILLDAIERDDVEHWGPLYVRWEAGLLEALGFGLDLSRCAATGGTDDLRFVSPKSGRAVSGAAGAPYAPRLLALPGFLLGSQNASAGMADIRDGLKLTGHFLRERALLPHHAQMPLARLRLEERMGRESA